MNLQLPCFMTNRLPHRAAPQRHQRPSRGFFLALLLWISLGGCQSGGTPAVLPGLETPTPAPSAIPSTNGTEEFGVIAVPDRQLVIWAPEFFQPHDGPPPPILADIYEQFRINHPDVHLDIQTKAESGEASGLNYLRYAQRMAPTLLPDVILMNTEQLWQVAELGLVQPIPWDSLTHTADFFQFARDAVSYQGQLLGIPYAADVVHLVYHVNQLPQAPVTWADVITNGSPYFFAAGRRELPNESLLLQYIGAGGQLLEDGSVSNPDALRAFFAFLVQAKAAGVLSADLLNLKSMDDAWAAFTAAPTSFADTSTRLVLAQAAPVDNLGFAQIPTINGAAVSVAHTWAFALLTTDLEQQQLALDLLDHLLEPAIQSAWSHTTLYLPTQITAYATWLDTSPYYEFLQRQLDVAIAIPTGRPFADFARRLQQAQEAVLLNQLSIDDAVKFVQTAP
ncbi:MAG: extracellular solute-binding protein [Caldilineaceae bacterium]|nr:extracellular solute-binding protein [Caldilineaceae bacterium]